MELQLLVSKKGTQVVTATNLHAALKLPAHKYNKNVEHWLKDVYAFQDDIRKPQELKDFAVKTMQHSKLKDYYISLEMARLITLSSDSPVKQMCAKLILSHEQKGKKAEVATERLTKDQVLAVIELTKVMGLISCQKSVEKEHQRSFGANSNAYKWWQYRAGLLGYSVQELKEKMEEVGNNYKNQTVLKMLFKLDKYEIIRMAVIDLFVALGKPKEYAKDMGDLAKAFAREMKVEIWDDRKASLPLYSPEVNLGLVNDIKDMNRNGLLSLW